MNATSYTQPTRNAENRTMTTLPTTKARHRKKAGAIVTFLAAALLIVLPTAVGAQQVLVLSATSLTVTEYKDATADGCTATYNARLNTEPSADVTVTVVSADTNVARVSPKTLTFTPDDWFRAGDDAATITVTCVDDMVANAGGERAVTITNTPSGGGFRTKPVQVTVYDNDEAGIQFFNNEATPGEVSAEGVAAVVDEGGTVQTDSYSVSLRSEPTGNVIVDVASGDISGATVSPASLTFTPTNWDKTQTVTVSGVNDSVANAGGSRTVTITHTPSGGGYGRGEIAKVTVTVNDQATAPDRPTKGLVYSPEQPVVVEGQEAIYTVKLRTRPTGTVTVDLSRSTSLYIRFKPDFLTFTTTTWNTPQRVTVTAFDDYVSNDNDNATLSRKTTITHRPSGGGYDELTATLTQLEIAVRDDDSSGLSLNRRSVSLFDAGNTATYTVVLRSEPMAAVTVTLSVDPASDADADAVDVSPMTLTFTAANWNEPQTVTITAENDRVDNDGSSRSTMITHSPDGGGYSSTHGDGANVTVEVVDDDTAELVLNTDRLTIKEGAEQYYTVKLGSDPGTSQSVTVSVPENSAATLSDGTLSDRSDISLSFDSCSRVPDQTPQCSIDLNPWDEWQTVTVTADDDVVDNSGGSRTVTITHAASEYDVTGDKKIEVKVTDNDGQSGVVLSGSVSVTDSNDSEGEPLTDTYRVKLASDATRTITVRVPDNSAAMLSAESLSFDSCSRVPDQTPQCSIDLNPWDEWQTVTVTVTPDNVDNGNRSVIITHTDDTDDAFIGAEMPVTIRDDDDAKLQIVTSSETIDEGGKVQYGVKLKSSPPSDTPVTVWVISNDPGIATVSSPQPLTFDEDDWDAENAVTFEKTVTVTSLADDVDNGTRQTVNITFTPSGGGYEPHDALQKRVTVIDEDVAKLEISTAELSIYENGGTQTYLVNLATRPMGTVTVTVSSSDANAATVDPSTLRFRPDNWRTPQQMVTVTGVSDATRGERKTTITNTPSGGGYGSAQRGSVKVTVLEDETDGIRAAPAEVTVAEGDTATFSVDLNTKPGGDVTVTAESRSPSVATVVPPTSLTFSQDDWNQAQQILVKGKEDAVVNGDRTVIIALDSTGGSYKYSAEVKVTVTDDDATVTVTPTAATVPEAGGTATYTMKLNGQPTDTVTVTVASSNTSAATVTPGSLKFTPSNWNAPQTVTVTGVDDDVDNGDSRSVTITNTSSGGGYDDVEVGSVSVTVTDDDGVTVTPTSVPVAEAGGTATYTVRLKTPPTGNVTVTVKSSNTGAATVTPGSLTFTPSNSGTPQTVTVTGVNDDVDNGDSRSVTITNTPSGAGYSSSSSNNVTVTVTDDEDAPTLEILGEEAAEGNAGTTTALTFKVTMRGPTDQVVTVAYADAGTGTATAGTDYTAIAAGTLTFAPSETSKTITVMVRGDDVSEPDETVVIALRSPPPNATIAEGSATGTIIDDDASRLSIKAGATSVDEGESLIFTVSLDPPIDDEQVTVEVVTGGTATAGADYTGVPETLTFAAGEGSKTITVAVVDDADYELDETVEVELSNQKPTGSVAIETGKAMVTIEENDDPPALSISGTSVAEGNADTTSKLTFAVTKSGGTSMEATVAYVDAGTGTAIAGTDYTAIAAGTLTFAPDETSKTITVVVKGDDESEGDETVVIRLTSPSNATIAEGKGAATGTIIDDDTLPRVATDWLARFGRTAAGATLDAIARRMNDGPAAEPSLTVAGHRAAFAPAPVAQVAAGTAAPWEEGRFRALTIEELANGSSFDAGANFVEGLNVWGASSYNQFEMTPEGSYTMDGSLVSAILGVDHQGDGYVAGLALAYHGGAGDFSGIGETEGSLGTNLYSVHPYVRLTFGEAIHVGASFGIGTGDLSIMDKDEAALVETGVGMPVLAAVDARMELSLAEAWILALQADGHLVQMVADEQLPRFTRVETNTHRLRLGVENSYAFLITDGVSLAPVLETGLRYDGGDGGETGLGFDIGVGLRLDATVVGLMVDARGHASLSNWGEGQEQAPMLRDWGLGGVIRWRPAGGGMGPEMSLSPAYGGTLGTAAPSLNAEIGYRMAAFGGVFTPYSAAEFGNGHQSYRAGAHFEIGQGIALSAEGTHRQSAIGAGEQFLTLEMRLRQ